MKVFIKPGEGRLVRDPITLEAIPVTGAWVHMNTFYIKRIKCSDAIECEPPPIGDEIKTVKAGKGDKK